MGSLGLNPREVAIVLQARNELKKGLAAAEAELRAFSGRASAITGGRADGKSLMAALGMAPGVDFKAEAREAATGIDKMGAAITGLSVAAAGYTGLRVFESIDLMIESTIRAGAEFKDLSRMTGASSEALSQYGYVAEMTGSSLETLVTEWRFMAKNLSDVGAEGAIAQKALAGIGLDAAKLRDARVDEAFGEIIDALDQLPSKYDKTNAAMAIFGRGGADVLKMASEHRSLRMEAEALATVTGKMADQFDESDDAMNRASAMATMLKRNLALALGQTITDIKVGWQGLLLSMADPKAYHAVIEAAWQAEQQARAGAQYRYMSGGGERAPLFPGIARQIDAEREAQALAAIAKEAERLGVATKEWRFEGGKVGIFPRDQEAILRDINTELNKAAATIQEIASTPVGWGFDKGVENFGPGKFAPGDVGYQPAFDLGKGQDERTKANLQSMHEYVESWQEINKLQEDALKLEREHAAELRRMKTEAIDGIYTGMSSIFDLVNDGNKEWAKALEKIYGWYRAIEAIAAAIGLIRKIVGGPTQLVDLGISGPTSPLPAPSGAMTMAMDSWIGAPAPSGGRAGQGMIVVQAPVTIAPGSLLIADDSMSIARLGDKLARHIETKVAPTFRPREGG